jgi:protein-tyrosine phosphatase
VIDGHCHILPRIDDGAAEDETAIAMARVALADGVHTVIATPHMREGDYINERKAVLVALESLRGVLQRADVPLELRAGAEVHLGPGLVEGIRNGRFLTYNDRGRHLLLECPYRSRPVGLLETIFELRLAGVTPVLAHPERIQFFAEDITRYEEALRLGALGQLTSSSLMGRFGSTVQRVSEEMVRRKMVHILASDAHDPEYRPPQLAAARAKWAALAGESSARLATVTYPQALLDGAAIEPASPVSPEKPLGLWDRLRGRR